MPNQGFLRVMQLKTALLFKTRRHNERWQDMPPGMRPDEGPHASHIKIDWAATNQNLVWRGPIPDDDGGLPPPAAWTEDVDTYRERAERRIDEIDEYRRQHGMRRMRHGDANWHIATEFIVGAADYMQRSTRDEQIEFLKGAVRWLADKYGKSNVISVAFHFDEPDGNPHAHVVLVPENMQHAVSASSMFTKGTLVKLQNEMYDGFFAKYGLDRHHHYEENEPRPRHKTKKEWMEKRQLEAERDAAIRERDTARADAAAIRKNAEYEAGNVLKASLEEADEIMAKARNEAEECAEKIRKAAVDEGKRIGKAAAMIIVDAANADRKAAAEELTEAKANKTAARKLMEQAEVAKAAAESKAADAEQRVVAAAKVLDICTDGTFADAVTRLRDALWQQAVAWDRRMKRALSPERRRKAEQMSAALRTKAGEIDAIERR